MIDKKRKSAHGAATPTSTLLNIDKNSITQIGRKVKSEKQQLRSLIYLCDCKKRQMEL